MDNSHDWKKLPLDCYDVSVTSAHKESGLVFIVTMTNKKSGIQSMVNRCFNDFVWLDNCIHREQTSVAHIFPPLPSKGKSHPKKSTVRPDSDEVTTDCIIMEKYISLLMRHYVFSQSEYLRRFLLDPELLPPSSFKASSSFDGLAKITKVFNSYKEADPWFSSHVGWLQSYTHFVKEARQSLKKRVFAERDLADAFAAMSIALQASSENTKFNRLLTIFSEAAYDLQHMFGIASSNNERTLGIAVDLQEQLLLAEHEMLDRRRDEAIHCASLEKSLVKAKPNKRAEIEEQHKMACETFKVTSETARKEVEKFHEMRVQDFKIAILEYAEYQLQNAQNVHTALSRTLSNLQSIE